jgi:hypothetical protein
MKIEFSRKIRKIGSERLLNIPEELREFEAGEIVRISVLENGLFIQKEKHEL